MRVATRFQEHVEGWPAIWKCAVACTTSEAAVGEFSVNVQSGEPSAPTSIVRLSSIVSAQVWLGCAVAMPFEMLKPKSQKTPGRRGDGDRSTSVAEVPRANVLFGSGSWFVGSAF